MTMFYSVHFPKIPLFQVILVWAIVVVELLHQETGEMDRNGGFAWSRIQKLGAREANR